MDLRRGFTLTTSVQVETKHGWNATNDGYLADLDSLSASIQALLKKHSEVCSLRDLTLTLSISCEINADQESPLQPSLTELTPDTFRFGQDQGQASSMWHTLNVLAAGLGGCPPDTQFSDFVNSVVDQRLAEANARNAPIVAACWDANGNGLTDLEEDVNGDGNYNDLDCPPDAGTSGANAGGAKIACWDLNGDGVGTAPEDINGDGNFDELDCEALRGPQGPAGEPGPLAPQGDMGERGEFGALKTWLNTKIHQQGMRYRAAELCVQVTGKPLSADHLLSHLDSKLRPLYGI